MKKLALLFSFFLLSFTAHAALPTDAGEFQVNVPILKNGLELGATALFIKASMPELDYALVYPTVFTEGGRYRSGRPSYDIGYQLFLGYRLPCVGRDLRLTYTEYEQRERDHVGAPDGILLPTLASPFSAQILTPPLIADIEFSTGDTFSGVTLLTPALVPLASLTVVEADVKNIIRQGSVDLDAGQYINFDNFARLRLFGGLRYSRVKNQLISTYLLGNFVGTETQVSGPFVIDETDVSVATTALLTSPSQLQEIISESNKFDGIGPRFGAEGFFHLGGGFGLVGSFSTAILIGTHQSSLSKTASGSLDVSFSAVEALALAQGVTVTVTDIVSPTGAFPSFISVTENFDRGTNTRIVPNIEAKIGLDYTTGLKHCRFITLEAGFYVNHYFSVLDRLSETSATSGASAQNIIDVGFSGPYVELKAAL